MATGYEAQLKSDCQREKPKMYPRPAQKGARVYIPKSYRPQQKDWMGNPIAESYDYR